MLKIVKSALATSILAIASTSLAASSGWKDAQEATLTVDAPIEFYISTETIPQDKWESIGQATTLANQEMGAVRIKLSGIFISPEAKQDNINSISFSNDFQGSQLNQRSRQLDYWANGKITEIDIIVNTKSFDYSKDQTELVSTLKIQLKKIFGQ
jgi:hypothetical protein